MSLCDFPHSGKMDTVGIIPKIWEQTVFHSKKKDVESVSFPGKRLEEADGWIVGERRDFYSLGILLAPMSNPILPSAALDWLSLLLPGTTLD